MENYNLVRQEHLNHNGYLFGGQMLMWIDEAKNKKTLEKLKIILDKNLENLMPDFHKHLRWAIYPAIWHLDGVAKTIDNEKPEIKTPVNNLYLIGDCVKAPGIGFNCALNSARILADILKNSNI